MKEQILNYKELKPDIIYFDLVKIFGLSIEYLLTLLDINNYKIKDKYILIYNANDKLTYTEYSSGKWRKYEYDKYGNCIYEEFSSGFWIKYEYNVNGVLIYSENFFGDKYEY